MSQRPQTVTALRTHTQVDAPHQLTRLIVFGRILEVFLALNVGRQLVGRWRRGSRPAARECRSSSAQSYHRHLATYLRFLLYTITFEAYLSAAGPAVRLTGFFTCLVRAMLRRPLSPGRPFSYRMRHNDRYFYRTTVLIPVHSPLLGQPVRAGLWTFAWRLMQPRALRADLAQLPGEQSRVGPGANRGRAPRGRSTRQGQWAAYSPGMGSACTVSQFGRGVAPAISNTRRPVLVREQGS